MVSKGRYNCWDCIENKPLYYLYDNNTRKYLAKINCNYFIALRGTYNLYQTA